MTTQGEIDLALALAVGINTLYLKDSDPISKERAAELLAEGEFDPIRDIEEFHLKFGLEYSGKPRALDAELLAFRGNFLQEEVDEYRSESELALDETTVAPQHRNNTAITYHLEEAFDALIDLVYVALGTAYLQGFAPKFKEGWRRVHAANMQKVRAERLEDSKRGSIKYDVIKPLGWMPPTHTDLVKDHAHKV